MMLSLALVADLIGGEITNKKADTLIKQCRLCPLSGVNLLVNLWQMCHYIESLAQ